MSVVWKITGVFVAQEPYPNTVARLEYSAKLGSHEMTGEARLPAPAAPDVEGAPEFTAYGDITEAQALEWLWAFVSKDAVEKHLQERAGAVVKADAPWGAK